MKAQTADAAAIELFNIQHGFALVSQLVALGLTRDQIAHRVAKGIFVRVAHGVVALGSPRSTLFARAMRGVLIAAPGAAACRWTAAELHGLEAPRDAQTHVVVATSRRPRHTSELYIHRTRDLPPQDIVDIHGIRTTSLPRTIVDCARELDHWSALRTLDSCSASAATWRDIHIAADRMSNGRAGVRAIANATSPDGADRLRSSFERIAKDVLDQHGIPQGQWNTPVRDSRGVIREVDLCYPDARVAVEFDGLRFHMRRGTARRDRATDRRLQLAGWRVLRFTWEDIVFRADAVVAEIREALGLA